MDFVRLTSGNRNPPRLRRTGAGLSVNFVGLTSGDRNPAQTKAIVSPPIEGGPPAGRAFGLRRRGPLDADPSMLLLLLIIVYFCIMLIQEGFVGYLYP